ncbi:MAG: hypothetical protein EPO51_12235 [Phenylobacterium sp.]|uniref:hypothetical protein n=1 Tax=Phenylobacterium sp. TaxID=1871053 RepID=UPI001215B936|nr:hypothetical protein [Phenylobacterium sp.]TAJ71880.1 MAG: hypothetical protein EPO51_12235 [Phenylobacterium sp.]
MKRFGSRLGAVAALALASGAEAAPKVSPVCAAAEAALRNLAVQGGDPLLFSTEFPRKWTGMFATAHSGSVGIPVGPQGTAALVRFDHRRLGPALACANARARAATLGEVVDEAAGEPRIRGMGLNGKTGFLWRIAMPVLDRTGMEAVVAAFTWSNQLAGGSQLVFLARQRDGSWKVTGSRILSMS